MKAAPLLLLCVSAAPCLAQDLSAFEAQQLPNLIETHKTVHAHPELSHHEEHTSALVADELRKAGYTVTDPIGVYPDGTRAFGVVGILKNGPGKPSGLKYIKSLEFRDLSAVNELIGEN